MSIGVRIIRKAAALGQPISAHESHAGIKSRSYHRDANIVWIGVGKSFKYEFEWSNARIPALAAVSPNLETGPRLSIDLQLNSDQKAHLGSMQHQDLDSISNILRFHRVSWLLL